MGADRDLLAGFGVFSNTPVPDLMKRERQMARAGWYDE